MTRKTITLSTQEDLKIFMSPQRQKLIREMHIDGRPMTAKAIADMLNISPSSAKHHIGKLEQLGLIELDHTKTINGILARYYKLTDVTVCIGQQLDDDLSSERNIIVQNILMNTLEGFRQLSNTDIPDESLHNYGDFASGVVHLTPSDSQKLLQMIRDFIETHEVRTEDTEPWEYALILYNAGVAQ